MVGMIINLYDSCIICDKVYEFDIGWGFQGDIFFCKCIYENINVCLKIIWDLWQLDIMGDVVGFYEWGKWFFSIYYYCGGDWIIVKLVEFIKIVYICGEDCSLQRFMMKDGYVIFGYFVVYYLDGVEFDWDMVERMMDVMFKDKGWNFDFMFGLQRFLFSCIGKKVVWDL